MRKVFRTPSPAKSFKARTTGRAKRTINRATNPLYGKKGMGFAKNPKRSVQNAVYHRTTFGVSSINQHQRKYKNKVENSGGSVFDEICDLIVALCGAAGALFSIAVAIFIFWLFCSIF